MRLRNISYNQMMSISNAVKARNNQIEITFVTILHNNQNNRESLEVYAFYWNDHKRLLSLAHRWEFSTSFARHAELRYDTSQLIQIIFLL